MAAIARLRATLIATLVGIATIVALIGASLRVPDPLLGIPVAHARAAEAATTKRLPRRLGLDEEARRGDGIVALAPSADAAKDGTVRRERDPLSSLRVLSPTAGTLAIAPIGHAGGSDELSRLTIDPPTRRRARLMVFLN